MDRNKSFSSMNHIAEHGHIRHVTLLFTILLLIIPNGCTENKSLLKDSNTRVTLQELCTSRPLHPVCRGSVIHKRTASNHIMDLLFDDYLRSKFSRTSLEDYSGGRWNMQNKLTNKERNDMYDPAIPTQRIKNNKLKLLDRLFQIRQMGEIDSAGRYARHANPNSQNANAFNVPDFSINQYTLENEY